MEEKIKQIKKYLSDKYYIEEWEWCKGVSSVFERCAHYGDNINVFMMWNKDSSNIYLEKVMSELDILKIKSIIKGSGVYLCVNNEHVDYE